MEIETLSMSIFGLLFFGLILLGLYHITIGALKHKKEKLLFFFITFSSITFIWLVLILLQKISYSPTRHQLILLPCFLISMYYGIIQLREFLGQKKIIDFTTIGLSACVIGLFSFHAPQILKNREDLIQSEQLQPLIEQHGVEKLVGYHFTKNYHYLSPNNLDILKENGYKISPGNNIIHENFKDLPNSIALISTREPLKKAFLPTIFEVGETKVKLQNATYEIIVKQEILSNTEVEFSSATVNGRNELFFYILKKI